MTTNRRATKSLLAVVAGLVGMVAFLAGPAAANDTGDHTSHTSGGAFASDGSVASGTAVAIDDSTASGDAVAIDGSVASGCSTAVRDSTASGADHCKSDRHKDADTDTRKDAGPAKATSGASLALTRLVQQLDGADGAGRLLRRARHRGPDQRLPSPDQLALAFGHQQ